MRRRAVLLPLLLAALAPPVAAQEAPPGPGPRVQAAPAASAAASAILTIDLDRLLAETRYGRRMAADLQRQAEALGEENERLRVELTAVERDLTDRRPTMEPEAFRAMAEAFDARVQRIRAEQDAKEQALAASVEQERQRFVGAIRPVLGRLMIESGASVVLDGRDVVVSAAAVDATDEAIAAIDATLGDGAEATTEAPDTVVIVPDEAMSPAPADPLEVAPDTDLVPASPTD